MPRIPTLLWLALLLLARSAAATVVVPWSDAAMRALADDVATGVVETVETVRAESGALETRATVRVATVLKGRPAARLVLRQPGGRAGDREVHVFGTTPLAAGDAVLVFARRDGHGAYRPVATGLGVYRLPIGAAVAGARLRRTLAPPAVESDPYTLLGAPPASRWFELDRGLDVAVRSANADPSIGRSRSDALIRDAFGAWNGVPGATVRLTLGADAAAGPSVAGGVCDGRSVIQFGDPADELADLAACSGVLAVGGFCSSATAIGPGGATYRIITEGDVVVNRRILDCYSQRDVAEVLTHEVGHVLGLGHSSENPAEPNVALRSATMFFLAHFDGRGAAVRGDDMAGIRVLYPADSDGDRIPDELDACPGTPAGDPADASGCACADPGHVACGGGDACTEAACDRASALCTTTPVDCTGGEPCLAGSCTLEAGCSTTPVTGFEAVGCALDRDFRPPECDGERVPAALRRLVAQARKLVRRAGPSAAGKQERLLERAARRLARALARVERAADPARRRPLSSGCAERLRLLVGDARLRVESRGAERLFDPLPPA